MKRTRRLSIRPTGTRGQRSGGRLGQPAGEIDEIQPVAAPAVVISLMREVIDDAENTATLRLREHVILHRHESAAEG
jgi:hypothetical protein